MRCLLTPPFQVFPGGNPWYFGEPNGASLENCAVIWPYRRSWNDVQCSHGGCGFCNFEVFPDLILRGTLFTSI